jgi:hypothetical protein
MTIYIEERVDYYAQKNMVGKLIGSTSSPLGHTKGLLPSRSGSPDMFGNSPFYPLFIPSVDVDIRDNLCPLRLPLDPSKVASTLVGLDPGLFALHFVSPHAPCSDSPIGTRRAILSSDMSSNSSLVPTNVVTTHREGKINCLI